MSCLSELGNRPQSLDAHRYTRSRYFSNVHGIAVDAATRHVFVNDRNNHRIQVFDENGKYLYERKPDAVPSSRHLLYIGSGKTTWTYDRTNNKMIEWDLQGYLLYSRDSMGSFPGFLWGVRGLSVDQEGNLCVAEVDSRDVPMFRAKPGADPNFQVRQARLLGLEVIRDSWHMIRSVHLAVAPVIVFGITVIEPTAAQERPNPGLSLSAVGITRRTMQNP